MTTKSLEEIRHEICGEIQNLKAERLEWSMEREADLHDRATQEEEQDRIVSRARMLSKELDRIDTAIRRRDAGLQDHCVDCGQTIPQERLAAQPMTSQCVHCKAKKDLLEKQGVPLRTAIA
jgi:DnaK suppressor protein